MTKHVWSEYVKKLRRSPEFSIVFGMFISALFLILFSKIVWELFYEHELGLLDTVVTLLVRLPAGPRLDVLMRSITELGSAAFLLPLSAGVLVLFVWRGWKREAVSLIICLAGAGVLNQLLKALFERARPDLFRLVAESGYSFPSGHSMVSFCVYGFFAYTFSRSVASVRLRIVAFLLMGVLVGVIGISRIYLGVHYPTDVMAGFVAGGTWLGFCVSWLHWREYRHGQRRRH